MQHGMQHGMQHVHARRWQAGSHAGGWSRGPGTGWPELPAGNTSLDITLTSSKLAELSAGLAWWQSGPMTWPPLSSTPRLPAVVKSPF